MTDTPAPRDVYYAEARSWANDLTRARARTARAGWIIACVACAIALLEGLALIALAPLKTVVPYTLLVDRNTGFVQALSGTHTPAIAPQAALTQSLLAQYVTAREGFDRATVAEQYRRVALWSDGAARTEYLAQMAPGAAQSPQARAANGTRIAVQIESVSPLTGQSALVRFVSETRAGSGPATRAYWVAVVGWRYTTAPLSMEERLINPLGFAVTSYRRDAETPPAPPEQTP